MQVVFTHNVDRMIQRHRCGTYKERVCCCSVVQSYGWITLEEMFRLWDFLRDCQVGDEHQFTFCKATVVPD